MVPWTVAGVAVAAVALVVAGAAVGMGLRGPPALTAAEAEQELEERAGPLRLAGNVVDTELRPVAGAQVHVYDLDVLATTDEGGEYKLRGVAPGTYVVIASAPGYRSHALSILVQYGRVAEHDFFLERKADGTPFHEILPFEGFLACQVQSSPSGPGPVDCGADASQTQCCTRVALPASVRTVRQEAFWQAQSAAASSMRYLSLLESKEDEKVADMVGPSGMNIVVSESTLRRHPGDDTALWSSIGAAGSLTPEQGDLDAGVVVNQQFSILTTLFHYQAGPAGFSAVDA